MEKVIINPSELNDKWGFDDGGLFYEELREWVYTRSPFKDKISRDEGNIFEDFGVYTAYISSTTILISILQNEVISKLDKKYHKYFVRYITSHNPLRVDDDSDMGEEDSNNISMLINILENMDAIEIDQDKFDHYANINFPLISRGYALVLRSIFFNYQRHTEALQFIISRGLRPDDITHSFRFYLDEILKDYSEEVLTLVSETLIHDELPLKHHLESAKKLIYV